LVLSAPVAAEQANELKLNPGIVQAGSPVYFLDSAGERASTMIGLQSEGSVAHEKASEIAVAKQRNQTEAAKRADKRLNEVAMAATNKSYTGLKKAEKVLKQVKEQTPEEADQGFSKALNRIQEAKERQPPKDGLFKEVPNKGKNGSDGGGFDPGNDQPSKGGSDRRGR
jgi:hypothetical protein